MLRNSMAVVAAAAAAVGVAAEVEEAVVATVIEEMTVIAAEMIIGSLAIIIGIRDRTIGCRQGGQMTRMLLYDA